MAELTALTNPDSSAGVDVDVGAGASASASASANAHGVAGLSWAPIGLGNMLNSGGTVLRCVWVAWCRESTCTDMQGQRNEPTNQRTNGPTNQRTNRPTNQPTNEPTDQPTS
mmetsp:Transcript_48592/g.136649  ORF Transcript_48592/g.136649 Transcript_48592/m.136649 type:complete len:112 (-) Transcript_48592:356-691(-)